MLYHLYPAAENSPTISAPGRLILNLGPVTADQ